MYLLKFQPKQSNIHHFKNSSEKMHSTSIKVNYYHQSKYSNIKSIMNPKNAG